MRKITNEELGRPSAGEFARMEKMPVAVVLDNVRSMQNVGAFFRTADAFAVERIALCGITATPPNREIHKTALGAEPDRCVGLFRRDDRLHRCAACAGVSHLRRGAGRRSRHAG